MKGQFFTYGGIALAILLASFVFIKISATGEVKRNIASGEGNLISFVNYANFLTKTFDASIEFISQRAAYDLGSTGGIEGNEIALWNLTYPSRDLLSQQLEKRIEENLPQGTIEGDRTVSWGEGIVLISKWDAATNLIGDVNNDGRVDNTDLGICQAAFGSNPASPNWNAACDLINDNTINVKDIDVIVMNVGRGDISKSFAIIGNKSFSIYDKSIDSRISLNPYEFSKAISSNYLYLLNAGRAILEDSNFNTKFNDGTLLSALYAAEASGDPRFKDLDFSMKQVSADISEVTIEEKCLEAYCLAPLKPGETGEIAGVPYDYLKLNFLISAATGTVTVCDGTVALNCLIPGFEHPNDERLWGDSNCGRINAKIDCNANSHTACSSNTCSLFEPGITSYSVSKTSVNVGEPFSINVNGNCPAGLPGKCLVECRVIHPDGHYIELDSWSDNGVLTMPSVTCNQAGTYTVSYCGIFTDYLVNGGWGQYDFTETTVSCS